MNDKIYSLITKILDSRLSPETQDEIVRFYLLPRNTNVRPLIELPDENTREELGPVKRPDSVEIERRRKPNKRAEDEAMKQTLGDI